MGNNLSHYGAFIAVAETKSVSLAAEKLGVSQPAVSAQIASLEEDLGVKILFRTNRGVTLTPEGQVLYEHVKKGVSQIDLGEDKLREMGNLKSGRLRIGVSDTALRFFLFDHIVSFKERYPDVSVTVVSGSTPHTLDGLRSGSTDFGVVSEPLASADTADFDFIPVKEIRDIFIAHPTCPLCRMSGVTKKQLAQYPINMPLRTTASGKYIAAFLGSALSEPSTELTENEALVRLAEQGVGISALVEDFAYEAIKDGRVSKIDTEDKIPERKLYIAYLKKAPMTAAARSMLDVIFETVDRRIARGGIKRE